jgi:formylglycine-generating enzyme required for sulfatase activity
MNRIFLLLLGVCLFACSNSESVYSQHDSDPILVADSLDGMLSVRLEQKNLHLGTNEVAAKANERPQMNVLLNYDFSIAKHEVTCREFNDLMKSTLVTLDCEIANLPATNLTYYDAVLFANARSKAEGFDTAYTYTAAVLDDEKHCSNLEGFAFQPEKEGYRLPTEA